MRSLLKSSKGVVFVSVMSAMGNVLSLLSIKVSPIVPSIPLGPISISLAFDQSHITTFIAALFGGPYAGGITGMVGGLIAAYEFGFSQGNLITTFGLPLGKAMTGVTAGLVMRALGMLDGRKFRAVLATIASYIPEGMFTALLFMVVFPAVFGFPVIVVKLITAQILAKALVEMVVMGLILAALLGNRGFIEYVKGFFI